MSDLVCVVLQSGCQMDLARPADWHQQLHRMPCLPLQIRQLQWHLQSTKLNQCCNVYRQLKKKLKEKFSLFSDHSGSLPRQQPGAMTIDRSL